jgi:predicted GTPase
MDLKYSKTQFEGFTHRFKVEFKIDGDSHPSNIDIYSNSDSYQELEDFINKNKHDKVKDFKIFHRASKREDELSSELINSL